MTLIADETGDRGFSVDSVIWCEVEQGFWVGNDTGEFLGTVEGQGDRFIAHDSARRLLGVFTDLEGARAAFTADRRV